MTLLTAGESVRARIGGWPNDPDVVQIVLLDHQMVPTVADVDRWVAHARLAGPAAVRTGAMFPEAAAAFIDAGFHMIDELALLETQLDRHSVRGDRTGSTIRTRRMRSRHLPAVAAVDRVAFGDPWGNDVRSLRDVMAATPRHRARIVRSGQHIDGFAIGGQSGAFGYLQRLAVHPDARRRGVATELIADATSWMRARGARTAMVNTALGNVGALRLYEAAGFRRRPETLVILELAVR